jgi:hypothetical protein
MRSYFQGGLELTGPSFAKLFDMKLGSYTKLKHVIEPRFDYDYIPDITDQARTPSFDEVDFASPTHTVRYALVQRLLGKAGKGAAREIASLELAGRYRFELPAALQSSPNATKTEPFDATLRVNAGSGLSVDARATYDAKNSKITSTSLTTSVSAGETAVALSLFDSRPVLGQGSAQLRVTGGVPIIPKLLRFDVQASYDLTRGKALETRSLLTVQGSCWKIWPGATCGWESPATGLPHRPHAQNVGSFLDITGSFHGEKNSLFRSYRTYLESRRGIRAPADTGRPALDRPLPATKGYSMKIRSISRLALTPLRASRCSAWRPLRQTTSAPVPSSSRLDPSGGCHHRHP